MGTRRLIPFVPPKDQQQQQRPFAVAAWTTTTTTKTHVYVTVAVGLVLFNIVSSQSSLSSIIPDLRGGDYASSSLDRIKNGIAALATQFAPSSNDDNNDDDNNKNNDLTFDILSIGSLDRLDYMDAQRQTFASHVVVRQMYQATEHDDVDQDCSSHDPYQISTFCRNQRHRRSKYLRRMANTYARHRWLGQKKNPVGWMCAQARPASAFLQLMQNTYNQTNNQTNHTAFPDYLIIMDDDTYYNMELVSSYLQNNDPNVPKAIAGCMVRGDQYSIPFGGFGLILSRGMYCCLWDCPNLVVFAF